jgi:hypothetical protein
MLRSLWTDSGKRLCVILCYDMMMIMMIIAFLFFSMDTTLKGEKCVTDDPNSLFVTSL